MKPDVDDPKSMSSYEARERVIAAVLGLVAAQRYHEVEPGSYSAMASAEMADDMLDDSLAEYAGLINST